MKDRDNAVRFGAYLATVGALVLLCAAVAASGLTYVPFVLGGLAVLTGLMLVHAGLVARDRE